MDLFHFFYRKKASANHGCSFLNTCAFLNSCYHEMIGTSTTHRVCCRLFSSLPQTLFGTYVFISCHLLAVLYLQNSQQEHRDVPLWLRRQPLLVKQHWRMPGTSQTRDRAEATKLTAKYLVMLPLISLVWSTN